MKKTVASVDVKTQEETKDVAVEVVLSAREQILAKFAQTETKQYIDLQSNGTPFVLYQGKPSPANYLAQLTGFSYEEGAVKDGKQLPAFVKVSFQWSGHATEKDRCFLITENDFPFYRGKLLSYVGTSELDDALQALVETQTAVVLRLKYAVVKQG